MLHQVFNLAEFASTLVTLVFFKQHKHDPSSFFSRFYCRYYYRCFADPNTFDKDCLLFAKQAWGGKRTFLVCHCRLCKNSFFYYNPHLFFDSTICTIVSPTPFPTATVACIVPDYQQFLFYIWHKYREPLCAQV